jgi:tetratricopeptide (TPR) repeat protein
MSCFSQAIATAVACLLSLIASLALIDGPLSQAESQKEGDRIKALRLFAEGVQKEREEHLMEALGCFEEAAKLDPDSASIQKALAMTYLAVGRQDDGAKLLQKVLDYNPQDCEVSYLYACLLRAKGVFDQSQEVLQKGLQSKHLRERPDLWLQMECDLGALCERLGKYEEAVSAFKDAVAIFEHPDGLLEDRFSPEELQIRLADVHERIGRNLLELRDLDGAAAAYRQAQLSYPAGAGRFQYSLAQISLRQGDLNQAMTYLSDYLKAMPQGTEPYELMIGLMRKLKRDAEILPWLEQASERDQFNVSLRLLLAKECAREGQVDKAEKIYLALASSGPSEQIYRDLFLLYRDHAPSGAQQVAEAIRVAFDTVARKENPLADSPGPAQLRAMVAAVRENADLARDVLPVLAELAQRETLHLDALQLFAAVADRLEMLDAAESLYGLCIRQPLPPPTEPLIYSGLFRVQWRARHYDALVDTCRLCLEKAQASNRVLLRAELAKALAQVQQFSEALAEADQALCEAKDGERLLLQRLRVSILLRADKTADAEAECQAMLKEQSLPAEVLEARYVLASVYSQSKRLAEAEAELAECLKIEPDNVAVNNDLGYLWADQDKNLAEAEAMIRKAIEQDRKNRQSPVPTPGTEKQFHDNACYIDSLGWVLFRRGQIEQACKELEKATRLPDGDDPAIWDHLGDVYLALEKRDDALAAWSKALHFYHEVKGHRMDERWRALREKMKSHKVKETPCQAIPIGQRSGTKKGPSTPNAASCGASSAGPSSSRLVTAAAIPR